MTSPHRSSTGARRSPATGCSPTSGGPLRGSRTSASAPRSARAAASRASSAHCRWRPAAPPPARPGRAPRRRACARARSPRPCAGSAPGCGSSPQSSPVSDRTRLRSIVSPSPPASDRGRSASRQVISPRSFSLISQIWSLVSSRSARSSVGWPGSSRPRRSMTWDIRSASITTSTVHPPSAWA